MNSYSFNGGSNGANGNNGVNGTNENNENIGRDGKDGKDGKNGKDSKRKSTVMQTFYFGPNGSSTQPISGPVYHINIGGTTAYNNIISDAIVKQTMRPVYNRNGGGQNMRTTMCNVFNVAHSSASSAMSLISSQEARDAMNNLAMTLSYNLNLHLGRNGIMPLISLPLPANNRSMLRCDAIPVPCTTAVDKATGVSQFLMSLAPWGMYLKGGAPMPTAAFECDMTTFLGFEHKDVDIILRIEIQKDRRPVLPSSQKIDIPDAAGEVPDIMDSFNKMTLKAPYSSQWTVAVTNNALSDDCKVTSMVNFWLTDVSMLGADGEVTPFNTILVGSGSNSGYNDNGPQRFGPPTFSQCILPTSNILKKERQIMTSLQLIDPTVNTQPLPSDMVRSIPQGMSLLCPMTHEKILRLHCMFRLIGQYLGMNIQDSI